MLSLSIADRSVLTTRAPVHRTVTRSHFDRFFDGVGYPGFTMSVSSSSHPAVSPSATLEDSPIETSTTSTEPPTPHTRSCFPPATSWATRLDRPLPRASDGSPRVRARDRDAVILEVRGRRGDARDLLPVREVHGERGVPQHQRGLAAGHGHRPGVPLRGLGPTRGRWKITFRPSGVKLGDRYHHHALESSRSVSCVLRPLARSSTNRFPTSPVSPSSSPPSRPEAAVGVAEVPETLPERRVSGGS
jgi:hypothetical protein